VPINEPKAGPAGKPYNRPAQEFLGVSFFVRRKCLSLKFFWQYCRLRLAVGTSVADDRRIEHSTPGGFPAARRHTKTPRPYPYPTKPVAQAAGFMFLPPASGDQRELAGDGPRAFGPSAVGYRSQGLEGQGFFSQRLVGRGCR
jgi:hypothetical protein